MRSTEADNSYHGRDQKWYWTFFLCRYAHARAAAPLFWQVPREVLANRRTLILPLEKQLLLSMLHLFYYSKSFNTSWEVHTPARTDAQRMRIVEEVTKMCLVHG